MHISLYFLLQESIKESQFFIKNPCFFFQLLAKILGHPLYIYIFICICCCIDFCECYYMGFFFHGAFFYIFTKFRYICPLQDDTLFRLLRFTLTNWVVVHFKLPPESKGKSKVRIISRPEDGRSDFTEKSSHLVYFGIIFS